MGGKCGCKGYAEDNLRTRAKALNLFGLLANWEEAVAAGWVQALIAWEEDERARRSLERRLKAAHIGRFKPLCEFVFHAFVLFSFVCNFALAFRR